MQAEPIVFIVDDEPQVRQSLSRLVESVGLAARPCASAQEFLDQCQPAQPGCIVLDVRMPGMGGLELHDALAAHGIELPVIVITGYAEVPVAVRAMKAGALDFLEKPVSPQTLLQRIQHAVEGDARARRERLREAEIAARVTRLTPRQREVLTLVLAGKSNKLIATELGVSAKAIESHRAKIMATMQAANVVELARLAFLSGQFRGTLPARDDTNHPQSTQAEPGTGPHDLTSDVTAPA